MNLSLRSPRAACGLVALLAALVCALTGAAAARAASAPTITTVAGTTAGFAGDNGPATSAAMYGPAGVAVDANGDLFITDQGNNVVREVKSDGTISTVAGNSTVCDLNANPRCNAGYSGDGGPATSAQLSSPAAVAVDASGNLLISDQLNG